MLYRTRMIRYVPDPAREEFVNLGVIVIGEHPGDIAVHALETAGQVPNIGGPREDALRAVTRLRRDLLEYASDPGQLHLDAHSTARTHLASMARNAYNMIQFSEERVADGESADSLAEFLFAHLVAHRVPRRQHRRLPQLRRDTLEAYRQQPRLADHLMQHPTLNAGLRPTHLDLAVAGENVLELNSAFTFRGNPGPQMLLDHVDAWAMRMQRIRESGGLLTLDNGRTLPVPPGTEIVAVVEMPSTERQMDLYYQATSPWSDLRITQITREQLPLRAQELERRLTAA